MALSTVSLVILHVEAPQGSVLRPMLANILITDLFLNDLESKVRNFVDDNKLLARGNDLEK